MCGRKTYPRVRAWGIVKHLSHLLLVAAILMSSNVVHADTVFGEHTWNGKVELKDERGLRVSKGKHTVVTISDSPIMCGIQTPSGSTLVAASALAGMPCIVKWSTEETATFTYIVLYDTKLAPPDNVYYSFSYTATFKGK